MSHLVVFDCEGTLTDSHAIIVASLQSAFKKHHLPIPSGGAIRRRIGMSIEEIIAILAANTDNPDWLHPEQIAKITDAYHHALMQNRGDENFREALFPGITALLNELQQADRILAIITAKSRTGLDHTLKHNQIAHLFTITHTANDGVMKPDPGILQQTMFECGAPPAHCVMIGDTSFDIDMAKAAHAIGIGVSWGSHPVATLRQSGAEFVANNARDLGDYLQNLW